MANNTTLRDGTGALFTAESIDIGSGIQRTSTAANLRVGNSDVAAANPVPVSLAPVAYTPRSGTLAGVATSATVAAAGTGYAVGDTITLADGTVLTVATLSGSAVATVTLTTTPNVAAQPSNPVAQASTTRAGTGATFTMGYGPAVTQIMAANAARTRGELLNPHASLDFWFTTDGSTPAPNGAGSKRAQAGGGGVDWTAGGAPTAAIKAIGTQAFQPYTAAEA
jgi:hypothetical protein